MIRSRLTRRSLLATAAAATITALPASPRAAGTPPVASPAASPTASLPAGATAACTLNVRLDTETRILTGTEAIVWRNTTGRTQDTLFLRLYPNAAYYDDAETRLSQIRVDGQAATPTLHADPTVAAIPLGRPVVPDDTARIDLAFETRVPLGASGSFGILGLDAARGSWALADWYPILAGWEPERDAWYLDAPTPFGDPTFPETAAYTLDLTAPEGFALVSTGEVTAVTRTTGREGAIPSRTWRVKSGPVREFAMTLLPETSDGNGDLHHLPATDAPPASPAETPVASPASDRTRDDPAVSLAIYTGEDIPGLADTILTTARTALPAYRALLGPLPIGSLEIASARLAGANGVSWPGMIWLDLSTLTRDGELSDLEVPGLRFTMTHEVGHQWIGGLVGLNSNDHGFLLEGLTNALAIGVIREAWGATAAVEATARFVAGPYSGLVRDGRDVIAAQPLTADTNVVLRALGVYGKAGLGFEAIRQAMGDAAWRAALGDLAARFRFGIITPGDLRAALVASTPDPQRAEVEARWTFWFEDARTTPADIDPVVQGAGA